MNSGRTKILRLFLGHTGWLRCEYNAPSLVLICGIERPIPSSDDSLVARMWDYPDSLKAGRSAEKSLAQVQWKKRLVA